MYLDPLIYSGDTITIKLFQAGVQIGADIPTNEVGVSGNFLGDMPSGSPGDYVVNFYASPGYMVAQGPISWDGTNEYNEKPTSAEIWDEVIEGTLTARKIKRIILAVLAGKTSGGGTTTAHLRDVADAKDRVLATVDNEGNRTAITLDGS